MTDRVKELCDTYGIDRSEVWQLPGGRAHAIKHAAIERIAAQEKIVFDEPRIIESSSASKTVVLYGTATKGDIKEWTFGEASPANNKNAYPFAMAEKRLKDRLTLKLVAAHGYFYSEEDADDFRQEKGTPLPEPAPVSNAQAEKTAYVDQQIKLITDMATDREVDKHWNAEQRNRQLHFDGNREDPEYLRLRKALADHLDAIALKKEAAE